LLAPLFGWTQSLPCGLGIDEILQHLLRVRQRDFRPLSEEWATSRMSAPSSSRTLERMFDSDMSATSVAA